uniref:Ribonuclease H-like domain-containing protein n=1 Tax=Tanacetum cinerariifolium TaxID=118510 RepID=A0A6L2M281_TANCI|nr:ribonuclease H-like domain-containing protein [Tanacetum cinerariifolium]
MGNFFTLGSTKEAGNVKILQSCNGLLVCSGSASPSFDYGTLDYGLQLFSSTTDSLIAYSDDDCAGCPTTRRSTSATPMDPPPKYAEWTKIDFIIRSWIFSTLAPSLWKRLVDLNLTTAKDALTYITDRIYVSVLNGLCSLLSNNDVVTFTLEGLPSTYEMISTVIVSRVPFPDLKTVRSLLTTHEMRLNARRGPSLEKVNNPCWSFAKGSYRFGDAYKYLHNGVHDKSTLIPCTSGSASIVPDVTRSDLDMLRSLLVKFGLNAPNTSTPSPLVAYTVSVPPGFPSVSAQLSAQPTYVQVQGEPHAVDQKASGPLALDNRPPIAVTPSDTEPPVGITHPFPYWTPQKNQAITVDLHKWAAQIIGPKHLETQEGEKPYKRLEERGWKY